MYIIAPTATYKKSIFQAAKYKKLNEYTILPITIDNNNEGFISITVLLAIIKQLFIWISIYKC